MKVSTQSSNNTDGGTNTLKGLPLLTHLIDIAAYGFAMFVLVVVIVDPTRAIRDLVHNILAFGEEALAVVFWSGVLSAAYLAWRGSSDD